MVLGFCLYLMSLALLFVLVYRSALSANHPSPKHFTLNQNKCVVPTEGSLGKK